MSKECALLLLNLEYNINEAQEMFVFQNVLNHVDA